MNTSEQLKAQAIVNAYGDNYGEMVDENGWATYYSKFKERGGIEPFGEYDVIPLDLYTKKWRPLSLRGIENNNGWTRMEPDGNNLPESGEYWVVDTLNGIISYLYHAKDGGDIIFWKNQVTHFQLINKPQPPIF